MSKLLEHFQVFDIPNAINHTQLPSLHERKIWMIYVKFS